MHVHTVVHELWLSATLDFISTKVTVCYSFASDVVALNASSIADAKTGKLCAGALRNVTPPTLLCSWSLAAVK